MKKEAQSPNELNVRWRTYEGREFPIQNEEHWRGETLSVPIPNITLRESSAIGDLGFFYAIGESWAHITASFLPPKPTVLDIGCGCGKLARFLYLNPDLKYVGLDTFLPVIKWCQLAFAGLAKDRFTFEHLDVYSELYNPTGKIKGNEVRLPVDDNSIDVVVCASLFTHLLLPECRHYLLEISRILKHDGVAIVSILNNPHQGQKFSGDPTRIEIDEQYFLGLASYHGLRLRQTVGNVYGQQVLVLLNP